ncbi:glycosyltransferase family 2 protein [Dawidia soli]|uniref:Glycosyltransferase family 2 protein n=1 Tax=Dawidia soli TaxID=2782352 RepID=A0AAP2D7H3_9BACT|nr:glycosyltransferase family 2 protein [Dawidia soli]MBT1686534.1 glycosyltransferase family 2 protein [Dawidia soli]
MATLSVVIITFNEEKNIGRCIESLKPVADEFVILDSLSTDSTCAIIERHGLTPVQRAWTGYSDSKNYANSLTTGDYILSIDADEALSPALQQAILQVKAAPRAEVYEVNRLTNYCGRWIRHSGWYPEYKMRLFKQGLTQWTGLIHEELVFNGAYTSQRLDGDLYHYSYPTIESHIRKIIPYSALAAEKDFNAGKRYRFVTHGLIKPWFMFMKKYFLQAGFLDGFYGFVIAVNSAYERHLRYLRFHELRKNQSSR